MENFYHPESKIDMAMARNQLRKINETIADLKAKLKLAEQDKRAVQTYILHHKVVRTPDDHHR